MQFRRLRSSHTLPCLILQTSALPIPFEPALIAQLALVLCIQPALKTQAASHATICSVYTQCCISPLCCCMQRSISLSPQQKKELLAGRHYYLTKLREVLQQRDALLATLEVTLPQLHNVLPAVIAT